MKSLDFALLLSKYLTQYLPAQRNLSSNTICSYRDTFKLLLIFCRDIQGFNIAKLPMTQLDRKCIEDFILWLRNIRKSSPSTCNQRLCAIHAFFDYVMVEEPQFMEQCIQMLSKSEISVDVIVVLLSYFRRNCDCNVPVIKNFTRAKKGTPK